MSEKMNVPELRFSEFSEKWVGKKLKTITSKIGSGSTPRGGNKVYQTYGIPFIRSQNVKNDKLTLDDATYISEKINTEMKNSIVQGSDILLNITGASIGRSCVVPDNFLVGNVNQHVCIIRLYEENSPYFLQPLLSSHTGQKLIYQGQTGSGREGLNFQSIASFKFILPSKKEQEKISSFLSSVDTKIGKLTSKVELLQEYKKGVMQTIFSQEIRFKDDDGNDYPEWKKEKLKNLLDMVVDNRGKTPPVSNKGIPLIEVNAIGNKTINYSNVSKFVDDETFNSWFRKYLQDGDILFSTVGQTAICSVYKNDINAVIAQNIVGLRFKNCNNSFMFYLLTEKRNNHQFKRIEMGAVQPSVKVSQMIHIKFSIPCFKEQTKIANFLSSIDSKIEQVQKQLDSTKEFKKALLQQMFV